MSHLDAALSVPMPKVLAARPRDRRGLPIPYTVWCDDAGRPHFTIPDRERVLKAAYGRRCAICGVKMERSNVWLVGGQLSAFASKGAYMDPPGHRACIEYALRVCPFLALPSYARRIDDRTLRPEDTPADFRVITDENSIPEQPPVFVAGQCKGGRIRVRELPTGSVYITAERPWPLVTFWKAGKQLRLSEAQRLCPELDILLDPATVAAVSEPA